MAIYIGLLAYLLLMPLFIRTLIKDHDRRERWIAFLGILGVFILLALKADTVGVDISGYKRQYLISAKKAWSEVDYVYFESGYTQLMKVFSKIGADFQVFAIFIYSVFCSAVFFFICKYSKNTALSLIIFVCYQFLVFSISGLRQTLAIGVCIYAFLLFDMRKPWWMALAVLLTVAASFFHQSALLFLLVLAVFFIRKKKVDLPMYLVLALLAYLLRPMALRLINTYIGPVDTQAQITLGGSFMMLVGLSIFMWYVVTREAFSEDTQFNRFNVAGARLILLSVAMNVVLSGSSLLRGGMYLNLFLIPCIPNYLMKLKESEKVICSLAVGALFIALFVLQTLIPNQFELCPYKFFWQS